MLCHANYVCCARKDRILTNCQTLFDISTGHQALRMKREMRLLSTVPGKIGDEGVVSMSQRVLRCDLANRLAAPVSSGNPASTVVIRRFEESLRVRSAVQDTEASGTQNMIS